MESYPFLKSTLVILGVAHKKSVADRKPERLFDFGLEVLFYYSFSMVNLLKLGGPIVGRFGLDEVPWDF